jgi:hypothetical protein
MKGRLVNPSSDSTESADEATGAADEVSILRKALTFYADASRYNGPNQLLDDAPDKWSEDAGLRAYRLDVTRDRGMIASKALEAAAKAKRPRRAVAG